MATKKLSLSQQHSGGGKSLSEIEKEIIKTTKEIDPLISKLFKKHQKEYNENHRRYNTKYMYHIEDTRSIVNLIKLKMILHNALSNKKSTTNIAKSTKPHLITLIDKLIVLYKEKDQEEIDQRHMREAESEELQEYLKLRDGNIVNSVNKAMSYKAFSKQNGGSKRKTNKKYKSKISKIYKKSKKNI